MKIALGVTGGIAAYKAAEITRLLQERGATVQVIMTRSAREFVRPLTFASLTGQKVITGLFNSDQSGSNPAHSDSSSSHSYAAPGMDPANLDSANLDSANLDSAVEHIAVAQGIDALLVAPATADTLARFAAGIADDFLSTLYLATKAPVIIAPAMNVNMWEHPATQKNVQTLRERGAIVVGPGDGYLACGMVGEGRLAANQTIIEAVLRALHRSNQLAGETILVTAGPTREPIDPVRFLGNRSSGKMGYAIAEQAMLMGAKVILVSGPVALAPPSGAKIVRVETTQEMHRAVMENLAGSTIVIKTAAVADYRPSRVAQGKIKRTGPMDLKLEPTEDILKAVVKGRRDQMVIGFAAETEDVVANARKKLKSKGLDAIVANDVASPGIGFDSDRNAATIVTAGEERPLAEAGKQEIARQLLEFVAEHKRRAVVATR